MFSVPLEAVARALEIRDAAGSVLKTLTIRARTAAEPVGKKEPYFVDLNRYQDGLYTLRHKSDGGDVDTSVYCCADYTPGTLAVIEITYKGGVAWTGVTPFQKYLINVTSRITDWFFDVNVRKQASGLVVPSQLSIIHVPVGAEPVQTFSVVGAADDPHGFVQFKSDAKLTYSQRPMHLRLVRPNAMDLPHPLDVINPVPLPSAITLQKDTLNNLITKIIVNV